ncbi:EamA family transporter [Niabella beijingensis]|uniref:EamA family transporter n=1 Tax=Niabella beijingensis TaxID=2872700 RepID=UPI001CBCEA84|nr:EamA family transporter [Niabella beijingensis]MBZ4192355.1 EamA family transporter [Niabella beijingensis]
MTQKKAPSVLLVVLAFAAVYLIWGSTYFFIEKAVKFIPPMLLGGLRFVTAGVIMLAWVALKGEKVWNRSAILHSVCSGVLMLFVGNGAVIWAEQYLHSSFVAIFLASAPIWFLVFDKQNWSENFTNKFTLLGVSIGLLGVIALFYEKITGDNSKQGWIPLLAIFIGNIGWVAGSLYSKYKVKNISPSVNSAWQILSAGIIFFIVGFADGSITRVNWSGIPMEGWGALLYLIVFGSIIAYSAYVYLLSVRSATQVSSYAYVNPLVAVLLGVLLNNDQLTALQLSGLAIILCSVFFINLAKKEQAKKNARLNEQKEIAPVPVVEKEGVACEESRS